MMNVKPSASGFDPSYCRNVNVVLKVVIDCWPVVKKLPVSPPPPSVSSATTFPLTVGKVVLPVAVRELLFPNPLWKSTFELIGPRIALTVLETCESFALLKATT